MRNAVVAARKAFEDWSQRSAFNRSQILYRIAEVLEGRRTQFIEELIIQGASKSAAQNEVLLAIDRCIYYAGWCDKYQQIQSTVNPVNSSHFNFSVPEPMGVVNIIAPEESSVLGLVSVILPCIAGGNTCVVLASESKPLCSISWSEVLATSDVPGGVVNMITGKAKELHEQMSSHMDVNAIVYCRKNEKELKTIEENASINVKRSFHWSKDWNKDVNQNPYLIMDLQEIKTTWHPIEKISAKGGKY
jgi:acyl-CoA reductase-like NAD-dependent aldehyde dehydrogenase